MLILSINSSKIRTIYSLSLKTMADGNSHQHLDIDEIYTTISEISYCQVPLKPKVDESSLKSLSTFKGITQQESICLGVSVEKFINQLIEDKNMTGFKSIKEKNKKGKKERDMIYENQNSVKYFECKTNIKLDTEKSKSTCQKIKQIEDELRNEFPEKEINTGLLVARYLSKDDIPSNLLDRYTRHGINVYGVNDVFNMLEIPEITLETYVKTIDKLIVLKSPWRNTENQNE